MSRQDVVVIGAGVAGLVAALELARRGLAVTLTERADTPGGKLREVAVAGQRLDAGPTVFTLREVFEDIFDAAGSDFASQVGTRRVDVLARHAWSAGQHLDLHAGIERSAEAIGDFAGAAEARRFIRFTRDAQAIYRTLDASFMRAQRPGPLELARRAGPGILLLAGYNGSQPLLDPMCGSGTFLVEAADIALNRAPGRDRRFAFEQLIGHNDILWHSVRNDAVLAQRKLDKLPLYGNDRDPELVAIARRNLARAEIEQLVTLSCGDATELAAPADNGLIVCNPPYGVRLDEQDALAELYPLLATWLKRNFAGWHAHFMTADTRLPSLMRLSTSSRPPLFNGPLACHVYGFELVPGSNRKEKAADDSQ